MSAIKPYQIFKDKVFLWLINAAGLTRLPSQGFYMVFPEIRRQQ